MDCRRHFIITNGRSGSNFFVQALNQHRQVVNYGEVLGDWTVGGKYLLPRFSKNRGPADYLDWLYRSRSVFWLAQFYSLARRVQQRKQPHFRKRSSINTIGVKEFAINLRRQGIENYLKERPDLHLIALVRENPVERFVSARILRSSGVVARTGKERSDTRIKLDTASLERDLKVISEENALVHSLAETHSGPTYRIIYEEFFALSESERNQRLADIQEFLGLTPLPLICEHRKLRQNPLSEVIDNYKEVELALSRTEYARWL